MAYSFQKSPRALTEKNKCTSSSMIFVVMRMETTNSHGAEQPRENLEI